MATIQMELQDRLNKELENETVGAINTLTEASASMKTFSLCMRSLYTTENVDNEKFRMLRHEVRNLAMVYLDRILPKSKEFVSNLKTFLTNYEMLSIQDWEENLTDILNEAQKYKKKAKTVKFLHERLLEDLKPKEAEAAEIILEFEDLEIRYQEEKKRLEELAERSKRWAIALLFIPVVNVIAFPMVFAKAKEYVAQATASANNELMVVNATHVIRDVLCISLQNFIKGLAEVAGFFEVLTEDIKAFLAEGDTAAAIQDRKDKMSRHYLLMKSRSEEMRSACNGFMMNIPHVRTDFRAIPRDGYDKNYVDHWLENKKDEAKLEADQCSLMHLIISEFLQ